MKNYIEVEYSKRRKPETDYPLQLAVYIAQRFHLLRGMRVLDNGCGRGDFLKAFKRIGLHAYGTDLSAFCPKVKQLNFNDDKLPFQDDYFDMVFSKSVLEHIENTEFYINEMKRVLKPGGVLVIMVPDWKSQYKIFFEDPTHIHPYCVESVKRLLEMQEFMECDAELFYQLPFVWKHPWIKKLDCFPHAVNKVYKNKAYRFWKEKMVLGWGRK